MLILINPHAPLPIYAQIAEQVETMIASGHLRPGDAMPSVRVLAEKLEINSLTVQKAYKELEHSGLLAIRKGVGAVVAASALTEQNSSKKWQPENELRPIVEKAKNLNFDKQKLISCLEKLWKD